VSALLAFYSLLLVTGMVAAVVVALRLPAEREP
jgi:hypothetical protein